MAAQSFAVDPQDFVLYKTDWEEYPFQALKNPKRTVQKEAMRSGDLLILKNKNEV